MPPRTRKSQKPGLRALEACGDGFWELDLLDGSAWFSEWFYRKLNWPADAKRTTLHELQPLLHPADWDELMARFRDHLEQGLPLDLELRVQVTRDAMERWHIRGSARRNDAGQPISLAGSMRDVGAVHSQPDVPVSLLRLRGAFDALPVAAAVLDAHGSVLEANRLWCEFPVRDVARAIARLSVATIETSMEFWLDQGAGTDAGARRLRVRARAFDQAGSRQLAVTLEDPSADRP